MNIITAEAFGGPLDGASVTTLANGCCPVYQSRHNGNLVAWRWEILPSVNDYEYLGEYVNAPRGLRWQGK